MNDYLTHRCTEYDVNIIITQVDCYQKLLPEIVHHMIIVYNFCYYHVNEFIDCGGIDLLGMNLLSLKMNKVNM